MKKLVRLYKVLLSPLLGRNCRFHPTCSAYAEEAFQKHGAVKGFSLSFRRILRCNPWYRAAMSDPVPERIDWRGFFRYKRP